MLDAVGGRGFADTRVGLLSGGEQQRVLIAHALASRPRLLLLDEPLANLDLRSASEVVALVARIARRQHLAVLISAHEMNPLLPVMDRIVYLAAGRAVQGRTEEVITTEVLSRLYGHHVDVLDVHGRILVVADVGSRAVDDDAPPERRARADHRVSALSIAPGFFSSGPVHTALIVGTAVAVDLRPARGVHGDPRAGVRR